MTEVAIRSALNRGRGGRGRILKTVNLYITFVLNCGTI